MQSSKKIWGVFNTLDKTIEVDELEEYEVWSKINSLKNEINCILKYIDKPWGRDISLQALIEEQFNLEYLIYYTRKFGVEFKKEPIYGEHIEQSESFNNWYKFWENHFKAMDFKTYRELIMNKNLGVDITKYLPVRNWKHTLEEKEEAKVLQKVY